MLDRPFILIGHRGVGKTYYGKALSQKVDAPHLDTDQMLMQKYNLPTIRDVYIKLGPDQFRKEETALLRTLPMGHYILSIGGGTMDLTINQQLLKSLGLMCWIEESKEEACHRYFLKPIPHIKFDQYQKMVDERHLLFQSLSGRQVYKSKTKPVLNQLEEIYHEL